MHPPSTGTDRQLELRARQQATLALMRRVQRARESQVAMLRAAVEQRMRDMDRLEELSTQLWNVWQLYADG